MGIDLGVEWIACGGEANRALKSRRTSVEAEAIEQLSRCADDPTEVQKKHVASGVVAARLPHGQRDTTIQKLIHRFTPAACRSASKPCLLGKRERSSRQEPFDARGGCYAGLRGPLELVGPAAPAPFFESFFRSVRCA